MSPLFSTRAGRAFRREGTTFVDADSAKGTLSLELGDEDLLYLRWRARDGSTSMREDLVSSYNHSNTLSRILPSMRPHLVSLL